MKEIVEHINTYLWAYPSVFPWLVALLLCVGLFLTVKLSFIQVRRMGHSLRVVAGKYDDPDDPGDVTHFQALCTALSATVGIGNIAGVALAIHYGGPGALFWMWITAFLGTAVKYTECTLAVRYRGFDSDGNASGGPMYYIEKGLGKAWKPAAIFFSGCAILSAFGSGNMVQANTVSQSAFDSFGVSHVVVGVILSIVIGAVILGGIQSIAKVASKIAPIMAGIYVSGAVLILLLHLGDVPGAFMSIFSNAFNPQAGVSGVVAGSISTTLLWGVRRGLFSNEAGLGSAAIAHAAAKTKEPIREGAVAMMGPVIDTLIICTLTGLIIILTGTWDIKKNDVLLPLTEIEEVKMNNTASQDTRFTIAVTNGQQEQISFMVNGSSVDGASLGNYDAQDRFVPFQGMLTYDSGEKQLYTSDGRTMDWIVRGNMLQTGAVLTQWAFAKGLEPITDYGGWIVTLSVFLFAISSIISWSYYGDRCVEYLFGAKYLIHYRLCYVLFVFLGAVFALELVWAFGDMALGLMALPNLIAIVLLLPEVLRLTKDYFSRMDASAKK